MANDKLATIEQAEREIEAVLKQCNAMELKEMPAIKQAITLSCGMTALRRALTDQVMREVFMPLMGSPLGFKTDRDNLTQRDLDEGKKPYGIERIRDVLAEGMIRGLYPVNNEINVISGQCYGAKNGFARLLKEYPGLTDLHVTPGVPHMAGDRGALVPMHATWRVNGKDYEMVRDVTKDATTGVVHDTRIPVTVNKNMGPDAIIGKATRKMYKAIYDLITGSTLTIEDGEISEAIPTEGVVVNPEPSPAPAPPEQDGRKIKLGGNGSKPQAGGPPPIPDETMRQPWED